MNTEREDRSRISGERGVALVEFALIFPIFMTIVLGMFSGGQSYNRKVSITNATGEASRYGATLAPTTFTAPFAYGTHGLDDWLRAVAGAVEQNADGDLALGVAGRSICVAYVHPNGTTLNDKTHKFVRTTSQAGTSSELPGDECFSDGRPPTERRVQILVRRSSPLEALFVKFPVTLTSRSVTRFEATS